jgi:putative tryptophan/tyrosine transport system substrate-binding protein
MAIRVGRRKFLAALGGAAAAWPLAARAQQGEGMRRVGVLIEFNENDSRGFLSYFTRAFAQLGWIDGRNVTIDFRWTASDVDRIATYSKELVDLQPNVLLVGSTPATAAVARRTKTIPIVFVTVADPIRAGFVESLPRPGGNLTGFINLEVSIAGKCLDLLTQIDPDLKRAAMMFNPDTAPGGGSFFLPSFEAAARSRRVEPVTAPVHNDTEIETSIAALGREPGGGLVCLPDGFMLVHRAQIASLATRSGIPTVGALPQAFAQDGGLLAYGADIGDLFRRAAAYVDLILRGARPQDLPVQLPTKFELVVNAKTAKSLGLTVPPTLLVAADEVIE